MADRRALDKEWRAGVDRRLDEHGALLEAGERLMTENTVMTRGIQATLEELRPVLLGVRAAKGTGRLGLAAAKVSGSVARGVLALGGAVVFVLAIIHGEGWNEAWAAFWRYMAR